VFTNRRVLAALVLASGLAACSRDPGSEGRDAPPPPVPVTVAIVERKPVPLQVRAIGTVQASNSVTVRARVGGILDQVRFKEGETVTEGQVLFVLDRRPLEAALRESEARLAEIAAEYENARRDAARYAELARRGLIAEQQHDQARTRAATLAASVRAQRAVVDNARIQVGYATIRAPIAGRTGALQAREGDLIKANDTSMVVINRLQPVDVAFAVPEAQLPEVQHHGAWRSPRSPPGPRTCWAWGS
jgi:multidrug efflux system membrane fusion protein